MKTGLGKVRRVHKRCKMKAHEIKVVASARIEEESYVVSDKIDIK